MSTNLKLSACITLVCTLGLLCLAPSSARAQFTPGNLVVQRVGSGSAALSSAATSNSLVQFNTTSASQSPITTTTFLSGTSPASAPFNLTTSGSATSEGLLVRSANGLFIHAAGYNSAAGTASVASTSSATVPNYRTTASVNGSGTATVQSAANMHSGNNIRGVVTVDGNFANGAWTAGAGGVVCFSGTGQVGSSTALTTRTTRNINIFNGQLFVSAGSTSAPYTSGLGVYSVGTGLPTSGSPAFTRVIPAATSSPFAFSFNSALTVCYLTDDGASGGNGGVSKFVWNGSAWALDYQINQNTSYRGLTVDWSNPTYPVIYAISASTITGTNALVRITDAGTGTGTTRTYTATTLATAGTNYGFFGVDFCLMPAIWTSTSSDDWATGNTTGSLGGSTTTDWTNWSSCLSPGINLSFQNVNTGTSLLSITATNTGTPVTNFSSIVFPAQSTFSLPAASPALARGFGGPGGTAYTLAGSTAITISGTSTTGSGITNNSGRTQVINIPLVLSGNQAFSAASGAMTYGGNIALGTSALTVNGSSNTLISSVISGSGTLIKSGTAELELTGGCTYTGISTVSQGTLKLNRTGGTTIPATNSITISGGTLKISSNQVINNLTLSSGTLVVDAGVVLTINGTYNATGGTVTNNGRIILNAANDFPGTVTTVSANFKDLDISSAVDLNKSITVTGTLNLASGTLTLDGNVLTVAGNTVTRNTGVIDASAAGSEIVFTNSLMLNLPANLFPGNINDLTVNGAGITLGAAAAVSGTLTLTDGTIVTSGTNVLLLRNTAVASGGGPGSYIDGPADWESFGTTERVFPVGKGGEFARVSVSPGQADSRGTQQRVYRCEYFNTGYGSYDVNLTQPMPLDSVSKLEYWEISEQSAASADDRAAKIKLFWRAMSDVPALAAERQHLRVAHFVAGEWSLEGDSPVIADNGAADGSVQSELVSSFSPFTLGLITPTPLPVTLLSMQAVCGNGDNKITWEIASEQNVSAYTVQRLESGLYTTLAVIPSQGPDKPLTQYSYTDRNVSAAQTYRLNEISYNNTITELETVSVNCTAELSPKLVIAQEASAVKVLALNSTYPLTCNVINAMGQSVMQGQFSDVLTISKEKLSAGIYILHLTEQDGLVYRTATFKIMID